MKRALYVALLVTLSIVIAVGVQYIALHNNSNLVPTNIPSMFFSYTLANAYPHDNNAFTEGLFFEGGYLYEATGINGKSELKRVNLTTGEVLASTSLSSEYFGEGIALMNDSVIQLTWQTNVGFVYDKETLDLTMNFSYAGEGWGLTYDGEQLIMSNGSDTLTFLDPVTFEPIGYIRVLDGNNSVPLLNELEYVNNDIYANVFLQRKIAIINPKTGLVKAWIDLSGLEGDKTSNPEAVLNGIAYDIQGDRLFVTGKYWSYLYEITVSPIPK